MAWQTVDDLLSFIADEDLTSDQFKIMTLDTTTGNVHKMRAITDIPIGVLQNAPTIGTAAVIAPCGCGDVSKIHLGATLGAGVVVSGEFVSSTQCSRAVAIATTQYPVGLLIEGGAADEIGTILLSSLTAHA